jgi:excisionase family DNA binding protein
LRSERTLGEESTRPSAMTNTCHDGRLMTVKAAATIVGCHEDTIRRAYINGQLRFVRLGRRGVRIDPVSLRQWLAAGGQTRAA